MCEDSFAPGSACSDCSSLDSDGHGGAAWAADDTSALDDMVGGITNGTRPPRALYVDVDAARCAPAGPGPSSGRAVGAPRGIRRSPAGGRKSPSMGWHSHLQRLTTRSVSMRALSPSPADPYGMQRVWMKSPNSTASTPRGWAGLGGGLGGLGGEDADDSHHGLARSVGGSDPALGRLWRGVGQGHGMDGVGRTSVGCLYSIREENRKSAKEAADQLLGVTSSPVVPIMERMSLSGARNVGNGGDR